MSTPQNVHAIIIGINDYPYAKLRGCVHDSEEVADYLSNYVHKDKLQMHLLHDKKATKANIVGAFNEVAKNARPDDAIFVHYSGHGSREKAHPIFQHLTVDGKNEVMVTVDSLDPRKGLVNPLADKETAYLLYKLSKTQAHTTVLFDCCHSGNGTRDIAETGVRSRFTDPGGLGRGLDHYVFMEDPDIVAHIEQTGRLSVPMGKHLLLAGSRNSQTAKELPVNGHQWGIFTYSLLETLKDTRGQVTYRDLVARASSRVLRTVKEQNPQLEAIEGANVHDFFLGGASAHSKYYIVTQNKQKKWEMNVGAIGGMPSNKGGGKKVDVKIYDFKANVEQDEKLSMGVVNRVNPASSEVELLNFTPKPEASYKATISSIVTSKLKVLLTREDAKDVAQQRAIELLDSAVMAMPPANQPSPSVEIVKDSSKGVDYRVVAYEHEGIQKFRITSPDDDRPVAKQVEGFNANSADVVKKQLEHISEWHAIYNQSNPHSTIRPHHIPISMEVRHWNEEKEMWNEPTLEALKGGEVVLEVQQFGEINSPQVKFTVHNKFKRNLFYTTLIMEQNFASTVLIDPCVELASNKSDNPFRSANIDEYIAFNVSETYLNLGCSEEITQLKLIVSTEEFDTNDLKKDGLEQADSTRGIILNPPGPDWATNMVTLRIRKKDLQAQTKGLLEGASVKVNLPDNLMGKSEGGGGFGERAFAPPPLPVINLSNATPSSERAAENLAASILPAELLNHVAETHPIDLVPNLSSSPRLNVLEINNVSNPKVVTADNPIEVELPIDLKEEEFIIPIARDGEFFIPLGFAGTSENGVTKIAIEQLPREGASTVGERGFFNTVKIVFQKFIGQKIGLEYKYPALTQVNEANGVLSFDKNLLKISKSIKNNDRILLVIHGFMSETRNMLHADIQRSLDENLYGALKQHYDVILAFDYDSYNTPLSKTSISLQTKLNQVGINSANGKKVAVLAHSAGGLVVRGFIEQQGGAALVNKVVMAGVPNNGTPWPKIKDMLKLGATLALNQIPVVGWPLTAITFLMDKAKFVGDLDKVSDDLKPGSDFLNNLSATTDPGIPYTLIEGNVSLIKKDNIEDSIGRLLGKIGIPNGHHLALTKLLFQESNDIIVGVNSMGHVDANKTWTHTPKAVEVACDHFTYFSEESSLRAIESALSEEEVTNVVV